MKRLSIGEKFWRHVDPCRTDNCWVWTGAKTHDGYGRMNVGTRIVMPAHHYSTGVPLKGLQVDHVRERGCINRSCVNPEHLEIVTPLENTRRGRTGWNNRIKTHCPKGHPYTPENTKVSKIGERTCRTCERAHAKRRRERIHADSMKLPLSVP